MRQIADGPSGSARKSSSVDSSVDVLRIDLRCIPSRRFPDFPANNSRPVRRRRASDDFRPPRGPGASKDEIAAPGKNVVRASKGEIAAPGKSFPRSAWRRAAARKNPGPARRKVKSPLPGKSFRHSVPAWSARRKVTSPLHFHLSARNRRRAIRER